MSGPISESAFQLWTAQPVFNVNAGPGLVGTPYYILPVTPDARLDWLSVNLTVGPGGNNILYVLVGVTLYQIVNYAWGAGVEYVYLDDRTDALLVAAANARVMFNTLTGVEGRVIQIWWTDNAGAGSVWNIRGRYFTLD